MKISVVIPFYKNYETIENLIRSVRDQDYNDYEIVVVQDGPDAEAYKLSIDITCKYGVRWEILDKNFGAPTARNRGAVLTTGEVLFFIDGDCKLYPGMLRECVTQLEMNPELDFVYGNYRFESKHDCVFPDFDPYLLETFNYVSTMSPVRRTAYEAINGFDEELKYFQDWDFFYRLTKNGSIGKHIKEFIFTTSLPSEENISGSQGMTLNEKAMNFRKRHGIDKKLLCLTHAADLQARQRAKMLDADYQYPLFDKEGRAFLKYDFGWKGTYFVGCFNKSLDALSNHFNITVGKPIFHFIGTDVFEMMNYHGVKELQKIKQIFKILKAKLFANSPRLVKELKQCGFNAELLYTPIYNIQKYKSKSLPKKFTVGVYCSDTPNMNARDGAGGMSHVPMIYDVASSMPDINFKFFGSSYRDKEKNLEHCGVIPNNQMVDFINSCSMVVRATIHDGYPQLPIQFLLCGRQALVTVPDEMKYAEKLDFEEIALSQYDHEKLGIKNYEDAKDEIITKIYDMEKDIYKPQELAKNAFDHYSELMSEANFKERIHKVL